MPGLAFAHAGGYVCYLVWRKRGQWLSRVNQHLTGTALQSNPASMDSTSTDGVTPTLPGEWMMIVTSGSRRWLILFAHMAVISSKNLENFIQRFLKRTS
ncbi:TPA: hypothetical protein ACS62C_005822, partial [Klebsiella pneumoniae]